MGWAGRTELKPESRIQRVMRRLSARPSNLDNIIEALIEAGLAVRISKPMYEEVRRKTYTASAFATTKSSKRRLTTEPEEGTGTTEDAKGTGTTKDPKGTGNKTNGGVVTVVGEALGVVKEGIKAVPKNEWMWAGVVASSAIPLAGLGASLSGLSAVSIAFVMTASGPLVLIGAGGIAVYMSVKRLNAGTKETEINAGTKSEQIQADKDVKLYEICMKGDGRDITSQIELSKHCSAVHLGYVPKTPAEVEESQKEAEDQVNEAVGIILDRPLTDAEVEVVEAAGKIAQVVVSDASTKEKVNEIAKIEKKHKKRWFEEIWSSFKDKWHKHTIFCNCVDK